MTLSTFIQHILMIAFSTQCMISNAYFGFYVTDVDNPPTWQQADLYCQHRFDGSHLATIIDSTTQERVRQIAYDMMPNVQDTRAWIGCTVDAAGNYEWASTTPFSYSPTTFWTNNEPGCCIISADQSSRWETWHCDSTFHSFVCDGGQDLASTTNVESITTAALLAATTTTTTTTTILVQDGHHNQPMIGGMEMSTFIITVVSIISLLSILIAFCVCAKWARSVVKQREVETLCENAQPSTAPARSEEQEGHNKLEVVTVEAIDEIDVTTNC